MGFAPGASVSGIVLSAVVRALYAGVVGISVFLLVPVRLGGPGFCANGHRVLQAQNLISKHLQKSSPEDATGATP